MAKDEFYDVITSKYLEPIRENALYELMDISDKLNAHLANQKSITYREYIDILRKYFKNADYPGCFWDILDTSIPVRGFVWDCFEAYTNLNKVDGKWVGDEKHKIYTWKLKPIQKRGA